MQASIYYVLVQNVYLSQPQFADYDFEFRFIVIDPYMQVAPIKISDTTLATWVRDTNAKLNEAAYHFENKNFDLPYQFLVNNELEI
jgi:hypothetical protein